MIENLLRVFRKNNLFAQALEECYTMLDLDWTMYEKSLESLRSSDKGEIALDVAATDKRINAYERDVRKKVMTHLTVSGAADLPAGLVLVTVVIDIERIGDYTKNIYDLARSHPLRLQAGSLEGRLQEVEGAVTRVFKDMIQAFKGKDEEMARRIMTEYKEDLSASCEGITLDIVSGQASDLSGPDAATVALYARYLKRIAAHSRNVMTSLVNPFHRIGYREKPEIG
jgi:phosphate uptake regulator